MTDRILIGKGDTPQVLRARYANRHGLVAGATGTGKTVTLQVLAEGFSAIGVPVFCADVKGDLSGLAAAGGDNPKLAARAAEVGAVRGAEVLDLQPGRDPREAGVSPREAGVLDDHVGRRRAPDHERAAVRDGHALDRLAVMHDERRPRAGRLARALHRVLRQGRVVVLAGQTVILVGRGRPRQRVP